MSHNTVLDRQIRCRRLGPILASPLVVASIVFLICDARASLADDVSISRGFQAGDVMIRGRISGLIPYNQQSTVDLIGGHVNVPSMILPDLDVSVFLSEHWSVTGQTGVLNTKIKVVDTLYGDLDVGTVWTLPLSLTVQYHPAMEGRFKPYIGAGMVATWYFGEKPAGGYVQDFSVSNSYAPLIKAGVDYQIDDKWFANFELKQVFTPTQTIQNQGISARTSLETISAGFGVGYRF
ncbi:OmpW/AlkL family protein [Agrobacterium arsenijevicii]|uniref:OmpW/AlkL family protein n=1 Tax=Agrobacterium arsenijevicii TaxID=1585697 RepID=UPI000697CB2C